MLLKRAGTPRGLVPQLPQSPLPSPHPLIPLPFDWRIIGDVNAGTNDDCSTIFGQFCSQGHMSFLNADYVVTTTTLPGDQLMLPGFPEGIYLDEKRKKIYFKVVISKINAHDVLYSLKIS